MNIGFIFKAFVVAIPSGLGVALTFKDIWEWLKDGGKDKKGGKRKKTMRKWLIIVICCIGSFIWRVVFPEDSGELGSVQNTEDAAIPSASSIWQMCKMLAPRILLGIAGAVILLWLINFVYFHVGRKPKTTHQPKSTVKRKNGNRKGTGRGYRRSKEDTKVKERTLDRRKLYCFIILLALLTMLPVVKAQAADPKHRAQRFNVVFVMDNSGSMGTADETKQRFDAMDLFLALSADEGNYVGGIIFNEGIVKKIELEQLNGQRNKMIFSNDLRIVEPVGQTDIGLALMEAVKMLEASANPELPSVIILLTDGVTYLTGADNEETKDKMQASSKIKEDAITTAINKHYQVYSVCFGEQNAETELRDISDRTDGAYLRLSEKENDIKKVFWGFYELIYDTETVPIIEEPIPVGGTLETTFSIPEFGVEEVNIILSDLNKNMTYQITPPGRDAYTDDELDEMRISAGAFHIIKIVEPEDGEWSISVTGTQGEDVTVNMVFNADYQVVLEKEGGEWKTNLGDSVELKAYLKDGDVRLDDTTIYQNHGAVLEIEHGGQISEQDMVAEGEGYGLEYVLDDYGKYIFRVRMPINGMEETSGEWTVYVENQIPWAAQENPEWTVRKMVFGEKLFVKDLTTMAVDAEDSKLKYEIVDYDGTKDWQPEIVSDTELRIRGYSEPADIFGGKAKSEGTVTLRALDSQGGSCEFTLDIVLHDMDIVVCRVLLVLLAAAIVMLIASFIQSRNRKFNGEVTIVAFNGGTEQSASYLPRKGIVALSRCGNLAEGYGIDLRKTKLQATGKGYIYLKSSKGYYSMDSTEKRSRKIRLDNNREVTVSDNERLDSGIRITYYQSGDNFF